MRECLEELTSFAQHTSSDDDALNFACTLINLRHSKVANQPALMRALIQTSVSGQLKCISGDLISALGRLDFCHRGLLGKGLSTLFQRCCLERQEPSTLDPHLDVSEAKFDRLIHLVRFQSLHKPISSRSRDTGRL